MTGQQILAALYQGQEMPYTGAIAKTLARCIETTIDRMTAEGANREDIELMILNREYYKQTLRDILDSAAAEIEMIWDEFRKQTDMADGVIRQ